MIFFEHVSKSYGQVVAVSDLSLQVRAGELFGFLGPNGAGKTTTIKMATGMLQPSSGRIIVAGYDIQAQSAAARAVLGYVPDTPYLYDKLTGFEFLEFAADLYSMEPRRTHTRAQELLELFGLRESAHDLIEGYSHGMKQKLVIASVLIHDPQVIFLDEPTTALDPKSARLVKEILRTLCDQGRTVFISTHVMEIAERMCDRVAIIDHGRIAALGSLPELRQLRGQGTLEDVFLGLTGETETAAVLRVFGEEASS